MLLFAIGCGSSPPPRSIDGYSVRVMQSAPVEIERYPSTLYRGRYAYLVEGKWWWPTDDGWVVFRDEPLELRAYRANVLLGLRGPGETPSAYGGGPPSVQGPPEDAPPSGVDSPSALRPR